MTDTKFKKGRKKTGGRKKGARNILNEKFFAAALAHFKKIGPKAFDVLFKENPTEYMKQMGSFFKTPAELAAELGRPQVLEVRWKEIRRVIVDPAVNHMNRPPQTSPPTLQLVDQNNVKKIAG